MCLFPLRQGPTLGFVKFCIWCGVGPRLGGLCSLSVSHTSSTTVVLVVVVLTRENPYGITPMPFKRSRMA